MLSLKRVFRGVGCCRRGGCGTGTHGTTARRVRAVSACGDENGTGESFRSATKPIPPVILGHIDAPSGIWPNDGSFAHSSRQGDNGSSFPLHSGGGGLRRPPLPFFNRHLAVQVVVAIALIVAFWVVALRRAVQG